MFILIVQSNLSNFLILLKKFLIKKTVNSHIIFKKINLIMFNNFTKYFSSKQINSTNYAYLFLIVYLLYLILLSFYLIYSGSYVFSPFY